MADNEKEFFQNLVDSVESEVKNEELRTPPLKEELPPKPQSNDDEPKVSRPKRRLGKERRAKTPKERPDESPQEMLRTFAKATVQKTVRFQPTLIAKLDAFQREQERSGRMPASFQRIQNEALELWLEKNAA